MVLPVVFVQQRLFYRRPHRAPKLTNGSGPGRFGTITRRPLQSVLLRTQCPHMSAKASCDTPSFSRRRRRKEDLGIAGDTAVGVPMSRNHLLSERLRTLGSAPKNQRVSALRIYAFFERIAYTVPTLTPKRDAISRQEAPESRRRAISEASTLALGLPIRLPLAEALRIAHSGSASFAN